MLLFLISYFVSFVKSLFFYGLAMQNANLRKMQYMALSPVRYWESIEVFKIL